MHSYLPEQVSTPLSEKNSTWQVWSPVAHESSELAQGYFEYPKNAYVDASICKGASLPVLEELVYK